MYRVYLGLGSNLGNRLQFLTRAMKEIKNIARIDSVSSIYETQPVGMESGKMFYNMAVGIETADAPDILLRKIKFIETSLGRDQNKNLQDRQIDIDILLYEGLVVQNETLNVPHVNMTSRRFVLAPLHEIAPDIIHPVSGKTIGELLRQCRDNNKAERITQTLNLTI